MAADIRAYFWVEVGPSDSLVCRIEELIPNAFNVITAMRRDVGATTYSVDKKRSQTCTLQCTAI